MNKYLEDITEKLVFESFSLSLTMLCHATISSSENPGAISRDDAIFSGESLLQELESPWELTLTGPVPEVVEFRPADWREKYFSGQSSRSSSRVTLSPSFKKQFSSSIDLIAWPVQRGDCRGKFQKKNIQRSRGNHKA